MQIAVCGGLPRYRGSGHESTNVNSYINKSLNDLQIELEVGLSPPNTNLAADCPHDSPKWLGVDYAWLFGKMAKSHEMHKVDLFPNRACVGLANRAEGRYRSPEQESGSRLSPRFPKVELFTKVLAWPLPLNLGNPPHSQYGQSRFSP